MARPGHRSKGRQAPRLKSSLATADRSDWVNPTERLRFTYMEVPALDALEYWAEVLADPLFVYFITEDATGHEFVKIGQAKDPFRRLLTLQTGNPRKLKLHAVVLAAEDLESSLHFRFAEYGTRGEWFGCGMGPALCALAQGVMERQIEMHRSGDPLNVVTQRAGSALWFPGAHAQEAA